MEIKDRLINDLAIQYMQLKIENMQMKYDIEELQSVKQQLELKQLEVEELRKKVGNEDERNKDIL